MDELSVSADLITYLQGHKDVLQKTLDELIKHDISKAHFFTLKVDDFRQDFKDITVGQRSILLGIIENENAAVTQDPDASVRAEVAAIASQQIQTKNTKRRLSTLDLEAIKKKSGRDVIQFVRTKLCLDKTHQEVMMDMIYQTVLVGNSPHKYYPDKPVKVAVAKGIITDFPELKDSGPAPYETWYTKFSTKCQSVRDSLAPEKKRRRVTSASSSRNSTSETQSSSAGTQSSSAGTQSSSAGTVENTASLPEALITWMRQVLANGRNKEEIRNALARTFEERQNWIKNSKPTPSCTELLAKYRHLASYKGEMLSEEFHRMYPSHFNFEEKFIEMAPHIWTHYTIRRTPNSQREMTELEDKFSDVNIRALVVLPKLLRSSLNTTNTDAMLLQHNKKKKELLDQIPSSAFIQIANENTCAESYVSSEYVGEELPVPPFILWLTSDRKSGEIYLKIDRKTIHIASFSDNMSHALVHAVKILIEAIYVFNLEYHCYLRHFYHYLEMMFGIIKNTKYTNVKALIAATRELKNASHEF